MQPEPANNSTRDNKSGNKAPKERVEKARKTSQNRIKQDGERRQPIAEQEIVRIISKPPIILVQKLV